MTDKKPEQQLSAKHDAKTAEKLAQEQQEIIQQAEHLKKAEAADRNKQQHKMPNIKEAEAESVDVIVEKVRKEVAVPTRSSSNGALIAVIFMILIALIAALAFYTYQEINNLKSNAQDNIKQQEQLALAKSSIDEARSSLDSAQEKYSEIVASNQALLARTQELEKLYNQNNELMLKHTKQVQDVQQRLKIFESRDPNDWLLAKSYFLLNSVYEESFHLRNLDNAIFQLQSADLLLSHIKTNEIVKLRKAIAKDISLLANQDSIDIVGFNIQLDEIYSSIDKLNLEAVEPLINMPKKEAAPTNWKDNLLNSAKAFSTRFVEIRRRSDNSIDEFLTPAQAAMLREDIKIRITMAKANLQSSDEVSFRENLKQARDLITSYFDKTNPAFTPTIENLDRLGTASIAYKLGDELSSYPIVYKIVEQHLKDFNLGDEKHD